MSDNKAPAAVEVVDRSRLGDSGAQMLDLVETSLDPQRVYHWARSRKEEYHAQVARLKRKGYRIETVKGGVKTVVDPDDRADGVIAIGDVVLMSAPRALVKARQEAQFRRREAVLASTSAETERMAKEKGISIIKDADHNNVKQG